MTERPEVVVGQFYEDVKEHSGRTLKVLEVKLQEKTEGRFKARYTYATVQVQGGAGRIIKIDTDRLRSSAYKLAVQPVQEPVGPVA